ncbi:glycosyltransferase family 2 protein [Acinetobacter johnsonii]|uniref:glycosyltransferase family 2 protein n=1 Tax=Acinetobacter johnsonii TaxID=40214 RepID=UPI003CF3AEA3
MNYIIVLNWNSEKETINCLESLLKLNNSSNNKIIICDNNSCVESYEYIFNFLSKNYEKRFISFDEFDAKNNLNNSDIYLIRNKKNYGYAGGNNIGIRFALQFADMEYVWILNNDTIVKEDSLNQMLIKIKSDHKYGVVGSRLVEMGNKIKVQGIGGIINTWLCTTKEIGSDYKIDDEINEIYYENKIDYVIGASLLISKNCLNKVGLLCEEYFLYYEEIDYCNRVKQEGLKVGISSKSIVFHEQGVSTGKGKSDIADYYSVRNRIIISSKFYPKYILFCRISMLFVSVLRLKRLQFKRAVKYLPFIFMKDVQK